MSEYVTWDWAPGWMHDMDRPQLLWPQFHVQLQLTREHIIWWCGKEVTLIPAGPSHLLVSLPYLSSV